MEDKRMAGQLRQVEVLQAISVTPSYKDYKFNAKPNTFFTVPIGLKWTILNELSWHILCIT